MSVRSSARKRSHSRRAEHHGLAIGDSVIADVGDKHLSGTLRFLGETSFEAGDWAGIELAEPSGKNDGSVKGERYFKCKPKHGLFVRVSKVTAASAAVAAQPKSSASQDRAPALEGNTMSEGDKRTSSRSSVLQAKTFETRLKKRAALRKQINEKLTKAANECLAEACEEFDETQIRNFLPRALEMSVAGNMWTRVFARIKANNEEELDLTEVQESTVQKQLDIVEEEPDTRAQDLFKRLDKNNDGMVSREEFQASGLAQDFDLVERARERIAKKANKKEHTDVQNWCLSEWLLSLNLHEEIADVLSEQIFNDNADGDMMSFFTELNQEAPFTVEQLLVKGHAVQALAAKIWAGTESLQRSKQLTAHELNNKFQLEGGAFGLKFGGLNTFFAGLEGLIGAPDQKIAKAMAQDHCENDDSKLEFKTSNYDMWTTSKAEWYFVTNPDDGAQQESIADLGLQHWPKEVRMPDGKPDYCRRATPLSEFDQAAKNLNAMLRESGESPVMKDEIIGIRLYTGPMFMKYNAVLRSACGEFMENKWRQLCLENKYRTTIHVINSAIVKAGKAMHATKVFRGIQGGLLPDEFWHPNSFNVRGGVEYAFMSTTKDREVAMDYATGGSYGTIFEIQMGMIDRGADLSGFSQYPHEQEICFAPLTGLEVTNTRVDGRTLVIEVRLNINLSALTIEQVLEKRKKVISDMCSNLRLEVQRDLGGADWNDIAEEVQCQKLPELVNNVMVKRLAQIVDRHAEDFNEDKIMKLAMETALTAVADARYQRAEVMIAAAESAQNDEAERIKKAADDYEKDEHKERQVVLKGGAPRGSTAFVRGGVLALIGLTNRKTGLRPVRPLGEDAKFERTNGMKYETLLAKWSKTLTAEEQMGPAWRLVEVNGQSQMLLSKLEDIYANNGDPNLEVEFVFDRPLTAKEASLNMTNMCKLLDQGVHDEQWCLRRMRRLLALNPEVCDLMFKEMNISEKAGTVLAEVLAETDTIQKLDLSTNSLGELGGAALARALSTNVRINWIDLNKNHIGRKGGEAMAVTLASNENIQYINLNNNSMGGEAGEAIAKAMETNSSITCLDLNGNRIGAKAGETLAKALMKNDRTSINLLGLNDNSLGANAAEALAKALETNASIKVIALNNNDIGEKGGEVLSKALEKNTCLAELYAVNNSFGEATGVAMANTLKTNTSLSRLDLSTNNLGENAIEMLAKALETNASITWLHLKKMSVGEKACKALAQTLELNTYIGEIGLSKDMFDMSTLSTAESTALMPHLEKNRLKLIE